MIRLLADAAAIDQAARLILAGGVVALPTDTLYGLAADPRRADAVARVAGIKERPAERAMPLIAADLNQVTASLGALPPIAMKLARAFWPGPLTIVIDAPPTLAPEVSGGTGRVGVRVPAHEVARALCRACGSPLTATSANISGAPSSASPDEIERTIGARIDMLLDDGPTPGGPASTIVDVTGASPRLVTLIRAGAVPWSEVLKCVDRG
jgi:L-threonylcarbamoyladenylate synthase